MLESTSCLFTTAPSNQNTLSPFRLAMFESTSTKHDTSVSDPLLADVEVQELEERDPPTYQQPSTEAMSSVRADGPSSSSTATQDHHAATMVYGLNLEWPIVPETIERQVVGVVFGSYDVGIPILSRSSSRTCCLPFSLVWILPRIRFKPSRGSFPSFGRFPTTAYSSRYR